MDELQRAKFILSTPSCSEMKCALESVTKIAYKSSEQHKSSRPSRIHRDYTDAIKILKYFIERDLFEDRTELLSIETGEVSTESVNVYDAKEIGTFILKNMVGQNVFDYSFVKKYMAVTMKSKSSVEIDGEVVPIDNSFFSKDC